MRKLALSLIGIAVFTSCFLASIAMYGIYLENHLRNNIVRISVGMSSEDVIQILGEPTNRAMSDIPGTYWHYRTDPMYALIDNNPDSVGHLVLEMGPGNRVEKVFDLK